MSELPARYRAVIFDLDGTLLDTLDDIGDAANRVLATHGFPEHPISAYRDFVGDGVRALVTRMLPPANRDEATIAAVLTDYREDYGGAWHVKTKPYADVPEMLDGITSRGIKTAILSNKPDEFTTLAVAEFLPDRLFDVVRGQVDGVPRKPDPAGARIIARSLDTPPSAVLFLGDSGVDMETANAAEMLAVGALWGFRTREELEKAGAHTVLANPMDLIDLL